MGVIVMNGGIAFFNVSYLTEIVTLGFCFQNSLGFREEPKYHVYIFIISV